MKTETKLIIAIIAGLGFTYCAGTQINIGDPWDPKESPFFDDGVDLIKDLSTLSGEWAYRQKNWLEGRIQLSDFVAMVEIQSVQTKTDVEGKEVKRIEVAVVEILYGETPSSVISLESQENAPGHELILRYERHLLGKFILFSRWFKIKDPIDPNKNIGHHFHLSLASKPILDEVKSRIQLRKKEEGTVEEVKEE